MSSSSALQRITGYGVGAPKIKLSPTAVVADRDPRTTDYRFPLGQDWLNESTQSVFKLCSVAGNSAVWVTLGTPNTFPITPYVVGPVGQAGYQTIQAALNAANAAGGGSVYVMAGTYSENLTLYGNTDIVAVPGNSDAGTAGNTTIISGVHIPPLTGSISIVSIRLESNTHIFSTSAVGSSAIVLENCFINITNGYLFNLPNWSGAFVTYNLGDGSTNNGMVNNTSGATCFFISATHGAGTGNPMITSGFVDMEEVVLNCPWEANTGTIIACDFVIFTQPVTCNNNSTGAFNWCRFSTAANTALIMSSSAAINMNHIVIDSSAVPVIAGAGAGTLTYSAMSFLSNSGFAGTLTLIGTTLTSDINTSLSSGTLSIKSTSANPGDNAGFIRTIVNGVTAYIPYYTNIAP